MTVSGDAVGPKEKSTIITVLGTGRSGTSLIMKILHSLGVYLGPEEFLMPPTPANPKGYFELEPVFRLNNAILAALGGNCWEPPAFPKGWEKLPKLAKHRLSLQTLLNMAFGHEKLFALKDPRFCWVLPLWRNYLPPMRYILALRNPIDVADSLKKSDGLEFDRAISYWHSAQNAALQNTSGQERLLVFYDDILEDWERELERIAHFIGRAEIATLPNVRGNVCTFIDKTLHRNQTSLGAVVSDTRIPFTAKALYLALRALVHHGGDKRAQRGISPNAFEKIVDFFAHQSVKTRSEMEQMVLENLRLDEQAKTAALAAAKEKVDPSERVGALTTRPAVAPVKDAPPEPIRVSIIIPVFGRLEFTRRCLETLYKNTPPDNRFEVIVVDNGSRDDTSVFLQRARHHYPQLRIFTQPWNKGFSMACNLGAQNALGEYLLFLNNDTEVRRGWLDPLLQALDADHALGAVGSKLISPDGSIQSAGIVVVDDRKGKNPLVARSIYNKQDPDLLEANQAHTYQALTGACFMVRKFVFEEAGGFDEEYWNGYEDVDLCFALREAGWKLLYQPKSVVVHHEAQSGPERFKRAWQNIARLHRRWLTRVKPDFLIDEEGTLTRLENAEIGLYHPLEETATAAN